MSAGPTKSAVRNWACPHGMWAAAVMSVAEGIFPPQEAALPQDQLDPLLRLAPLGAQALLAAKAQETVPEAEVHIAVLEKNRNPGALFSDIF